MHACMHTYMHAYIHTYIHTYTHNIHTHIRTHKHTHTHTYTYMHTCMHTYMHTHTHTYTHTPTHCQVRVCQGVVPRDESTDLIIEVTPPDIAIKRCVSSSTILCCAFHFAHQNLPQFLLYNSMLLQWQYIHATIRIPQTIPQSFSYSMPLQPTLEGAHIHIRTAIYVCALERRL